MDADDNLESPGSLEDGADDTIWSRRDPAMAFARESEMVKVRCAQLARAIESGDAGHTEYLARQAYTRWFAARRACRLVVTPLAPSPIRTAAIQSVESLKLLLLAQYARAARAFRIPEFRGLLARFKDGLEQATVYGEPAVGAKPDA